MAANKFLAKLATELGKPDGLMVIEPGRAAEVLGPLPVGRMWGVGAKGEKRLHALGVHTIGQLAALSEEVAAGSLGEAGRHLWRLAHGRDDRAVTPDEAAKSVSVETTFARDVGDRETLRGWLMGLSEELGERMRRVGVRGRTIELKVRTSDFRTFSRSATLPDPTDLTELIWRTAADLFDRRVAEEWLPLRLLGVGATGLRRDDAVQGHLFEGEWRKKQGALDQTVDAIRRQFGGEAIRRARRMNAGE